MIQPWVRTTVIYSVLLMVLVVVFLWSAWLGSVPIAWSEIISSIWVPENLEAEDRLVLLELRWPRIWLAMIVGASLAVAGMAYQSVLQNVLAEPYIMGVSSGAALGTVVGSAVSNGSPIFTIILSILCGMAAIALVFSLLKFRRYYSSTHLLLAGVIVNVLLGALMLLAIFMLRQSDTSGIMYLWMGSMNGVWNWEVIFLGLLFLGCTTVLLLMHRGLTMLSLGEHEALAFGIDVERVRWIALTVSSLLVAVTVAFVGMIGFVGLVIPHITRSVLGSRLIVAIPAAIFAGATFMLLADSFARSIKLVQTELPVGVVTACLGAPLFLYLLGREKIR